MAPALAFVAPAAAGTSLLTPSARPGVAATCRSPAALPVAPPRMAAGGPQETAARAAAVVAAAVFAAAALAGPPPPAAALTSADIRSLTYEQVKGTGLANRCPEVDVSVKGTIPLSSNKSYKLVDLCLEPKTFQVEEEVGKKGDARKAWVDTKLMTRATYTLTGIEGTLRSEADKLVFEEKEGIDYAATTVQLPGGERLPFLFTIKELVAKAAGGGAITTATEFGGTYRVPSYRTGGFLDPKGRGMVTGYDMAVGLPAMMADGREGQSKLEKETNKVFEVTDGEIEMAVNKLDAATGELGGVFVAEQLSDTDMGAKAPKKVLVKGVFYGRVAEQ